MTRSPDRSVVLHRYAISGNTIDVYDRSGSALAGYIVDELNSDGYGLRGLAFADGDCVIDIGGHIGLFAIHLAMQNPGISIYSYEPHPLNFELFRHNLALNGIANVRPHPEAVSGDGRPVTPVGNPTNSGAPTANSLTLATPG